MPFNILWWSKALKGERWAFTNPYHVYFRTRNKLPMSPLFSKHLFASAAWIPGEIAPPQIQRPGDYTSPGLQPKDLNDQLVHSTPAPTFLQVAKLVVGTCPRSHSQWMAEQPPGARAPTPHPGSIRYFQRLTQHSSLKLSQSCCRLATWPLRLTSVRSQHFSTPPRSCGAETLRGAPRLTKWK